MQYKNDMGRAIWYDTVQCLEINIIVKFFGKNRVKENAYFYAVVEEAKY